MGCDFFYSGSLPDIELQEKVIKLISSYYENIDCFILPRPEQIYKTLDQSKSSNDQFKDYPFNYYGIIPHFKYDEIFDYGQFVFDRSNGGKLISILGLPPSLSLCPDAECPSKLIKTYVVIKNNGYTRGSANIALAFLLNLIKIRWWPEFDIGDDYNVCDDVYKMIISWNLYEISKDETLDFKTSWNIFLKEYELVYPPVKEPNPEEKPKPIFKPVHPNATQILIDDLELSIRTSSCLNNENIKTIGQLLNYTESDLLKIRNFGRKSLFEIKEILLIYGVHLKKEDKPS